MIGAGVFLLAQLSLAALGAGAAFHPAVRSMHWPARAAAAFGAGAVALTLEATLFSIAGVPWSILGLAVPLLLLSFICALLWRRLPGPSAPPIRLPLGTAAWSAAVCGVSLLYLLLSLTSSAATSMDFLFFWGIKAVLFADARGIAADFLRNQFAIHAPREYPPLVPVTQAWGCLAAGKMPWRIVPVFSGLWAAAAVPLLFERFRRRAGDERAAAFVALWTAALSVSLVRSFSGGNAEAPLLYFESVALAWLLTEEKGVESRFVPILALCGAALTKVEGLGAVLLVAAGSLVSDRGVSPSRRLRRAVTLAAWPVAAVGVWFLYQASQSLPVGYAPHGRLWVLFPRNLGEILEGMLRNFDSGSLWLPGLFALTVLLASRAPAWKTAAPALALAAGILGFLVFDYLHDPKDPAQRIDWTTPRVIQPALSAMILAAGAAALEKKRETEASVP